MPKHKDVAQSLYFTNECTDSDNDDEEYDSDDLFVQRIGPKNFREVSGSKELAAVIVTICDNESYDKLFRQVEQTAPNPDKEYVSVFQVNSIAILALNNYMKNNEEICDDLMEIMDEINTLSGDCVVFNWECCGGCSDEGFSIDSEIVCEFVRLLLDRQILCMFSDFSLKALIGNWHEDYIGPNPFIQVGEFGESFDLAFSPQQLLACPSVQLQKVGELCASGKAKLSALDGTIRYTLRPDFETEEFEISVLTIVTKSQRKNHSKSRSPLCRIGSNIGFAGHVILTYPSGGKILTSCGHWLELVKLDVSVENLLKAARNRYGSVYTLEFEKQLKSTKSVSKQKELVQNWSKNYVQSAAPCNYKCNDKKKSKA